MSRRKALEPSRRCHKSASVITKVRPARNLFYLMCLGNVWLCDSAFFWPWFSETRRNCGVFNLFTKPLGNSILEDSCNLHNPLPNFISFFRWVTPPSSGFLLYALLSSQESIDSFPHCTALVLTFLIAQSQMVKRDCPPSLPYQSRNKRELTLVDEFNFVCKSTPALQHRESHLQRGSPVQIQLPVHYMSKWK